MKSILLTLCVVFLLLGWSCQNMNSDTEQFSDEDISFNLSENGKFDPELLIGEWDAVKFAYTADGQNIAHVIDISNAVLIIPVAPTPYFDCDDEIIERDERWSLHCVNWHGWLSSLSGYSIKLTLCGSTFVGVPEPHEEFDIQFALINAYSFIVKGEELKIFFTEGEKNKGFTSIAGNKKKNLIIFKKR